jgi:hypothetical protein
VRRRNQSSAWLAARRAALPCVEIVVAVVTFVAPARDAWLSSPLVRSAHAQGDFQQRRPDQPDAGAPRKAPVLTRAPRLKSAPPPVYPPAALAAGATADVTLQIDIDATGRVSQAKVIVPAAPVIPARGADAGAGVAVSWRGDAGVSDGGVTGDGAAAGDGAAFDAAAIAAARAMTFEPAEIDGRPSAIRIEYVLHFRPPHLAPAAPVGDAGAIGDAGAPITDAGGDGASAAADGGGAPDLRPRPPALWPLARGILRERGTRDPIEGAEVRVIARGDAVAPTAAAASAPSDEPAALATGTTDAEGRFVVEGLPGQRVRVVVASGLHEPCIRDVVLPEKSAPLLELTCLVARTAHVYETVVEAPRRGEEVTRHTLSQPELTSVPGTFGDPLRVIQNLPGMSRAPYGLGLLLIRGASPQDSGVYIDGHKVPLLYHFAVGPSIMTPDLIDRIDFYPGGFGVRYGRASAGVVDVTTRTEEVRRTHGTADVDFLDAGAYLEGPIGGGYSLAAAARRSYIDTLLPAVLPEGETVAAPVYWDYQARVSRVFSPGEKLSLFAFGSRDTLDVISSNPDSGDLDLGTSVMFHRLIGVWTKSLGDWSSRLSPSYGYDALSFRAGSVDGSGSAHVLGLREELSRAFGKSLSLVVGVDNELRFDKVDFDVPLPPERRTFGRTRRTITNIARTLTNLGVAGYAELLWDVTARLRVVPGLRFDWFHYAATDKLSLDPRLVARFRLSDATAFKGGLGIFHQPPTPAQLDEQFGNPRLPLIYAHQYHLGIEHALTPALSFDGTLYFMRKFQIPMTSTRRSDATGFERYAPEGRGRGYGLELLLKHRPTRRFFGWIAYSLSRSEDRRLNPFDTGPPTTAYQPTLFDQTHNLTAVASWTLGAYELGARFRLVSGVPETPVVGSEYDADANDWDPVQGTPGSSRRQTFHQLDLRVERTWTFDAWRFSLYLDVQNVYNAQNPEATVYDYRYRQSGPVRGLPVLPVLGIKGRF